MSEHNLVDIANMDKNQLNRIKKDDIIDIIKKNKELINETTTLKEIKDSLKSIQDNIINIIVNENNKLKEKVNVMESVNKKLTDRVVEVERNQWATNQYRRRNNIEINGIPNFVENKCLENTVCTILNGIGVEATESEIEACHRLPLPSFIEDRETPKTTIVRFTNRKISERSLINRKKLKDIDMSELIPGGSGKLAIKDNLCPHYKTIMSRCKKLLDGKEIKSYWSWFGKIYVNVKNGDDLMIITHVTDLYYEFPDFDFKKKFTNTR